MNDEQEQTPNTGTPQETATPENTPAEENPAIEPQAAPDPAQNPTAQDPDFREKFRQSSSEAAILAARNKQLEDRNRQLTTQDAPSEADLKAEYPDWEQYNAFTKQTLSNQLALKRRNSRVEAMLIEITAEQKWQAELRALVLQPKYAKLKTDSAFEAFVFQPKHKGLDIETLADAYMLRTGQVEDDSTITSSSTPPRRGEGLPRGSGGNRAAEPPKSGEDVLKMDPRELRRQMKASR